MSDGLAAIYGAARERPSRHAELIEYFEQTPIEEVTDEWRIAIAQDPFAYYQREVALGQATTAFFDEFKWNLDRVSEPPLPSSKGLHLRT